MLNANAYTFQSPIAPQPAPANPGQVANYLPNPDRPTPIWGGWQQTRFGFEDAAFSPRDPHYHGPTLGYGLDLDGNGKFNPKQDGYLAFDLNRDGQYSDQEVAQSRNLLKAFSGDFDVNSDGNVDFGEFFQGFQNYFQARSMDQDRDGILSQWELQRAGGAVVQPGKINVHDLPPNAGLPANLNIWQSYRLDSLPNGQRLDFLNPWNHTFQTSPRFDFLFNRPNA
ncbi:MAG: hypothetical protein AB7S38_42650 [Vulcanimicrobiota bacterium]